MDMDYDNLSTNFEGEFEEKGDSGRKVSAPERHQVNGGIKSDRGNFQGKDRSESSRRKSTLLYATRKMLVGLQLHQEMLSKKVETLTKAMDIEAKKMRRDLAAMEKEVDAVHTEKYHENGGTMSSLRRIKNRLRV